MDHSEQIMPPAAMYEITGLNASTFRGHKSRGIYEGFGIVTDGSVSAYSVFQIAAVKATTRLVEIGVELQAAAKCVEPIYRHFDAFVAEARAKATEFTGYLATQPDIKQPYEWPTAWSLRAPFLIEKVRLDVGGPEQWRAAPIAAEQTVQQLAPLADVAIVVDFGRILGGVMHDLRRGGALRADEI